MYWSISITVVVFLSFASFSSEQQSPLKLELASVVFRHGDRSPIGTFPHDKYNESQWPQGYGQLSITGMQQEEELGKLLRLRYINGTYKGFLSENYQRLQVTVRSTDVDRTLMSASTLLSALYPADEADRFNQSLPWQPIPVHTVPVQDDMLLRGYSNCPAYSKLRDADSQTAKYKQIERDNQDFFTKLTKDTGFDSVNLSNIWNIEDIVYIENVTGLDVVNISYVKHIWNIIYVESVSVGKEAPEWATPLVISQLKNLSDYTLLLMFNTKQKNRLTAGSWLDKVLSDMKKKVSQKSSDQSKLFLYSAHDTTVACMLSAFGLFNKQPPYATAFFVELLSDSMGNYYVQFSLRVGPNSTSIDALEMAQCKDTKNCTLEEFEKIVQPLISPDVYKECNEPSPPSSAVIAVSVVASILMVGFAIISLILGVVCCEKRKVSSYRRLKAAIA